MRGRGSRGDCRLASNLFIFDGCRSYAGRQPTPTAGDPATGNGGKPPQISEIRMYETQLLKIRIRAGKTARVIEFLRSLRARKDLAVEAMRREGMTIETMFLERHDDGDYLYYYAKARDLAHANQVNMQATDALTLEIREFVVETWDHIVSPEPLLDLDLIQEEAAPSPRPRRKPKAPSAAPAPHALVG